MLGVADRSQPEASAVTYLEQGVKTMWRKKAGAQEHEVTGAGGQDPGCRAARRAGAKSSFR